MELTDLINPEELSSLNEQELAMLKQVMGEFSDKGHSPSFNALYSVDYEEIPVSIEKFISDRRYLGNSCLDAEDKPSIYGYWRKFLSDLYAPDSVYFEAGLSGAIGLGKSTIAAVGMAYVLYKLLCLKNPESYYKLLKGSKIALAFFNISLDQSYGVGYSKLQSMLKNSPWFLEHGSLVGIKNPTYHPGKGIEILVGSKMEHFLGRDIFAGFMDEVEFLNGADAKMEQSKIFKLYTTIKRRMESRYMKLGKLPGMLFLVSSKKSDQDFLETYLKSNKDKPYLKISDDPIWIVKADQGNYCGKTFQVAVGNRYQKSQIIKDESEAKSYRDNGQEVLDVPIEHKEAFDLDINSALMDIAGKALSSSLKYIYYDKLKLCYRDYLRNPFTKSIISLGFDDDSRMEDFLDSSLLSVRDRGKPHFVHWDTSKTGDASGFGMTTIAGHKDVRRLSNGNVFDINDIIHKVVMGVKVKASPGQEIPFYKIRNFIFYLKFELGYNIISTTADSYQSVDTLQQFKLRGFLADTLSVDRTRSPYETLKNAINEGRLITPFIDELERELLELEDDKMIGKIDHPINGSKDLADAIAASVFRSINYKALLAELNKREDASILIETNKPTYNSSDNWISGGKRIYD